MEVGSEKAHVGYPRKVIHRRTPPQEVCSAQAATFPTALSYVASDAAAVEKFFGLLTESYGSD
jgi:hypothetical protein